MRFKRRIEIEHGLKQIDIAPIIDMVFLLLIFFMLTSSFVLQTGIKVNLPRTVTSGVIKYENIELAIDHENKVYLNGRVVLKNELNDLLLELIKRNPSVLIKADKNVTLGKVVEIWDLCRELGFSVVNIASDKK